MSWQKPLFRCNSCMQYVGLYGMAFVYILFLFVIEEYPQTFPFSKPFMEVSTEYQKSAHELVLFLLQSASPLFCGYCTASNLLSEEICISRKKVAGVLNHWTLTGLNGCWYVIIYSLPFDIFVIHMLIEFTEAQKHCIVSFHSHFLILSCSPFKWSWNKVFFDLFLKLSFLLHLMAMQLGHSTH